MNFMERTRDPYREQERCIQHWVGRPDRKSPLRKQMRRWKDNIKIDIQEVEWMHGLHCSDTEWGQTGALVNEVIKFCIP